jgi:hypothetical protein
MGQGGMFLCTFHPFEKDEVINVSIPSRLTVKAAVRNYQPGIGMSIEFVELDSDQRVMIRKFIEERSETLKKSSS